MAGRIIDSAGIGGGSPENRVSRTSRLVRFPKLFWMIGLLTATTGSAEVGLGLSLRDSASSDLCKLSSDAKGQRFLIWNDFPGDCVASTIERINGHVQILGFT